MTEQVYQFDISVMNEMFIILLTGLLSEEDWRSKTLGL